VSHLVGLDVGTTGCRAVVFDEDGTVLASASREYAVDMPRPGWAEHDIEQVWEFAIGSIRDALAAAGSSEVAAVGLSVHGEAVTPLDGRGRPLRPTILGMDTRTGAENEWLRREVGSERLYERTGMPVHTINTLPKLLWIRQHEPDVWARAERFVLVEDYLVGRMTGHWVISDCLASRTQLLDLRAGRWDDEIVALLGLPMSRLSEVRPSGSAVGALSGELTRLLGLAHPPLVVNGGHDQACGALGVGLTEPGMASVSTGTAEVVEVALRSPILAPQLREGNISVYRHVAAGLYLAMTLNHSGGLVLRWFRDGFCEPQSLEAETAGRDAYDLVLAAAPPGPTSLLVLPHFAGAGTPTFDTASRGAILGLGFGTTRGEVAKAILEGLTYELRVNLDLLRASGVGIDVLRAIGGGARSALWLQLKADITGIPVVRPRVTEAAALGAALLAGAGAGLWPSAAEAARRFLELTDTYLPDPRRRAEYDRRYQLYREVYPAVAPISHHL
jgi:xylulokinase